jgi:hypothetical protein
MAIIVNANPAKLTWSNFTVTGSQILDPNDNSMVDAYTAFRYSFQNLPAKQIDGKFAFPDPWIITITPTAQVWSGVQKTADLLSHEQWHYDVGIVTARALARELSRVRTNTELELRKKMDESINLHFIKRAGILQKRYDIDTRHGTNAYYQKIWKDRMTACLANANADQIGGFWL